MDPQEAALMQMQIKHNATDLQDYLKGLDSWEADMKQKDAQLSAHTSILKEAIPPVRSNNRPKKQSKKPKSNRTTQKPSRIKSYDFKAWDKFDVDKACEDVDYQVEEIGSSSEEEETNEENLKKQQALYEKEKGNDLFKNGKYEEAVECYSKAVSLSPVDPVMPANRAMALLKLERFAAAEKDCSLALALDDGYLKAYLRRGTARIRLGNLEEASEDFKKALEIEPGNKLARTELAAINKEIGKKFVKAVKRKLHLRSKQPLKRIEVKDIGGPSNEIPSKQEPATSEGTHISEAEPENLDNTRSVSSSILSANDSNKGIFVSESNASHSVKLIQELNSKVSSTDSVPLSKDPCSIDKSNTSDSRVEYVLKLPPVPDNSLTFQADWKMLKRDRTLLSQYFKNLPVSKYSVLLQQSLETDIFTDIITILLNDYAANGISSMAELEALTRVKRFTVAVMFLSSADRKNLESLFTALRSLPTEDNEEIDLLAKKFGL